MSIRVHRKAVKNCWRILENFHCQEYTQLYQINGGLFIFCTSPLAVFTVVGLLDVVTVSNSTEFKFFLLIMCIDAPESTKNYLSSGLLVDAGRHLFSEGEKNGVLCFSLIFRMFLASLHAASRAHRSCHSVCS